jgi:hypothetical protein
LVRRQGGAGRSWSGEGGNWPEVIRKQGGAGRSGSGDRDGMAGGCQETGGSQYRQSGNSSSGDEETVSMSILIIKILDKIGTAFINL